MPEYRKQAHCTYHTRYHLVFVTKYRRKILKDGLGKYLQAVLRNVSKAHPDIEILEMNTDEDHIHLLTIIPPRMSVSDAVRLLKSNSARAMKQRFPFLSNMYEHEDLGMWSDGYFVSTIGANESVIQLYIRRQGQEDKGQAKLV
jgi:putative transposase